MGDIDADIMKRVEKLANDLQGVFGYIPAKEAIIKALSWNKEWTIEMIKETIKKMGKDKK